MREGEDYALREFGGDRTLLDWIRVLEQTIQNEGCTMVRTLGGRLRAAISKRLCIVALVSGIATLGGCATSGGMAERRAPSLEPGALIVQNNNWNNMTVYVAQGGDFRRIGEVNGFSTAVFPPTRLGSFGGPGGTFLIARPLAGRAFRSEPLVFSPGRTVIWTIENQPLHSHLSVR